MAHTKSGGSTSLGRDSVAKRLGAKVTSGEKVRAGSILVKQRGTVIHAGKNVKRGGDDTLYAVKDGTAKFTNRKVKGYDGNLHRRKFVQVV